MSRLQMLHDQLKELLNEYVEEHQRADDKESALHALIVILNEPAKDEPGHATMTLCCVGEDDVMYSMFGEALKSDPTLEEIILNSITGL